MCTSGAALARLVASAAAIASLAGCGSPAPGLVQRVDSAGVEWSTYARISMRLDLTDRSPAPVPGIEPISNGPATSLIWIDSARLAWIDGEGTVRAADLHGGPQARFGGGRDSLHWLDRASDGGIAAFDLRRGRVFLLDRNLDTLGWFWPRGFVYERAAYFQAYLGPVRGLAGVASPRAWTGTAGDDTMGVADVLVYLAGVDSMRIIAETPTRPCRGPRPGPAACGPEARLHEPIVATRGEFVYAASRTQEEVMRYDARGSLRSVLSARAKTETGFDRMIVDHRGRLWLRSPARKRWLRIDPELRRISNVDFPSGFEAYDVWNDTVLGVHSEAVGRGRIALLDAGER